MVLSLTFPYHSCACFVSVPVRSVGGLHSGVLGLLPFQHTPTFSPCETHRRPLATSSSAWSLRVNRPCCVSSTDVCEFVGRQPALWWQFVWLSCCAWMGGRGRGGEGRGEGREGRESLFFDSLYASLSCPSHRVARAASEKSSETETSGEREGRVHGTTHKRSWRGNKNNKRFELEQSWNTSMRESNEARRKEKRKVTAKK